MGDSDVDFVVDMSIRRVVEKNGVESASVERLEEGLGGVG